MSDLFDFAAQYPNQPGFRRRSKTSKVAAEYMKDKAPTLRDQVLALLKVEDLTADECADKLGKSILAIRPRLSELRRLGKIFDTDTTRPNASGVQASVWRAW